jgi:uncharacterized protein (DUF305 family)
VTAVAPPPVREDPVPPAPARRSLLRVALLAVIAVGLLVLGGGLAVVLGIGAGPATPATDSVDAGFARDMGRHHLQGVEMANYATDRSTDPQVRRLAFDIASTQTNQVGRMQGWLDLWGLSQSSSVAPMAWMGDAHTHVMPDGSTMDGSGMGAGSLMPGMATEDELAQLRSLSGQAFDVRFLQLMIRHHQGGLEMALYAQNHASVEAVRGLARSIAETQTAEVATMTDMLTARGAQPLPAA